MLSTMPAVKVGKEARANDMADGFSMGERSGAERFGWHQQMAQCARLLLQIKQS
jgi:hypothetical protein